MGFFLWYGYLVCEKKRHEQNVYDFFNLMLLLFFRKCNLVACHSFMQYVLI